MDTKDLRTCGRAVYLVTDETSAKDIERHLNWAADEIERLHGLSVNNAHSWDAICRERDGLRHDVERLRAALAEIYRHDPLSPAAAITRLVLGESDVRGGQLEG
jgi:hypothetical protein